MRRLHSFTVFVLVAALLLSACAPVMPAQPGAVVQLTPATLDTPQGLRPDAPEYAKHGPFWVGYKPVLIGEGMDQEMEASLWYPALNPNGVQEEVTYAFTMNTPEWRTDLPAVVYGHALQDASPDDAQGPYPLVIFSHGFSANAVWYAPLLEHLASHGFVVLAPEHVEAWDPEWSEMWTASIDRPRDIVRTIDYAEALAAPDGEMPGLIDMENVAVMGHSYGGYTALAMGGAQYDLDTFNARCADLAVDDPNAFLCTPLVPHEADMAERAGLDPMPEGLWPSFGDPRVTAIVPLAGDSYLLDEEGLSKITVPMLAIGGTADTGTPYDWGSKPSYDFATSAHRALVTLEGAEHLVFMTPCENMPSVEGMPFYEWICFDPTWDKDRALDLINHFATAFLLAELKGDAEAAAALAPENVNFPGIQYETTAYTTEAIAEPALDAATIGKIGALVEDTLAANDIPGVALGVVQDGALVYAQGYGVANLDTGAPITPETLFQVAEVTFTPTAMAVLQLAAEGKLDLDAPVTDYLPYFAMADPAAAAITIRQILLHRAGIPDSGDTAANWPEMTPETDDAAAERLVRSLVDRDLLFAPGTGWEWSDLGYDVLGDVIAKVTGQSYEAYVQEHILAPLGMTSSTLLLGDVDTAKLATPHVADAAGKVAVSAIMPYSRQYAAANNLYTNTEDMAKLAQALLNRGALGETRILPEEAVTQMWTQTSDTPYGEFLLGKESPAPMFGGYGIGWFVAEANGYPVYNTYGGEYGYNANMVLCPDLDLAVMALGNGDGQGSPYTADITTDVMGLVAQRMEEMAAAQ